MDQKTVLIGMSGGVDSSVAAWLLQERGYRCIGGTMLLHDGAADTFDANQVAVNMAIPFYIFDHCAAFRQQVMEHFVQSYEAGLTPNPCTVCNKHLKFGTFLQQALAMGCDFVATGHYARIEKDETTGRYLLKKAADDSKEQTYCLYSLDQHQLSHTLFPLGALTKEQARTIAQEQGFLNARKKDSQDICFIPDGDYPAFLRRFTGKDYPAGNFLDENGQKFFGEGPARLLRGIEETGSLRAAAMSMDMAYTKALKLIRNGENALGFALIHRSTGGKDGGGSSLTTEGKEWLQRYEAYRDACIQANGRLYLEFFPQQR